jgi:hypothetical protein
MTPATYAEARRSAALRNLVWRRERLQKLWKQPRLMHKDQSAHPLQQDGPKCSKAEIANSGRASKSRSPGRREPGCGFDARPGCGFDARRDTSGHKENEHV